MSEFLPDPYADDALARRRDGLATVEAGERALDTAQQLDRLVRYDHGAPIPAQTAEYIEANLETWTGRRRAELEVAARLQAHRNQELRGAGEKMLPCHVDSEINLETDDAGAVVDRPRLRMHWHHKCHQSRVCPHEARAAAQQLIGDTVPAVQLMRACCKARVQYWVLSPPNVPFGELADAKRALYRQVARLLGKLRDRGDLLGAFVTQEDPLARDGRNWNVHFNVLAVLPGPYAPWRWIREQLGWQCWMQDERAMIRRTAARLRRRGEGGELTHGRILQVAMQEVVKYSAKLTAAPGKRHRAAELADDHPEAEELAEAPALVDWSDDALEAWWYANKGFRRVRSYGWLNGQVKLKARDFTRYPPLRCYEGLAFDASPAVQGARIRAHREALELTRPRLAERVGRELGTGVFPALARITELEPGDGRRVARRERPKRPLTAAEAEAFARALNTRAEDLVRLRGVSMVEIARWVTEEAPAAGWKRAGFVRWHRGEQRYRALYLIQAAKSPRRRGAGIASSTPRGPPAGPRGADPPADRRHLAGGPRSDKA